MLFNLIIKYSVHCYGNGDRPRRHCAKYNYQVGTIAVTTMITKKKNQQRFLIPFLQNVVQPTLANVYFQK